MLVIWRDSILKRIILYICIILLWMLIVWIFLSPKHSISDVEIVESLVLFLIGCFTLFNLIRTRPISVTKEGINMGNIPNDEYFFINIQNVHKFVSWNEINEIDIYGKEFVRFGFKERLNRVLLTTKHGEKLDSEIKNPEQFIDFLKTLKQDRLVSNKSKFLK